MLRPSDLYDATAWYTGADLGGSSTRAIAARRIFYGAMRAEGFTVAEIRRVVKKDRSTIMHALRSPAPSCYIEGVRQRAREAVAAE